MTDQLTSNESLIAELRFAGGVKSIDPVTRDLLRRARAALEGQNAHETRVSSQYRALAEEFIASNDLGEPRRNATRFFADWLDWRNTQKASGETPEGRTCLGCGRSYPCPSDCPAGNTGPQVVAAQRAEIEQLRGNLSLAEEGLANATQEIAMLKGPGNATQAQLDAATKPLHAEIERLRAIIQRAAKAELTDVARVALGIERPTHEAFEQLPRWTIYAGEFEGVVIDADPAGEWVKYADIDRSSDNEICALRLPDDPQQLLVTTARDAGFSDTQWKAMFYEQGPYDVTFPCFTTKKFIALLLERLQPAHAQKASEQPPWPWQMCTGCGNEPNACTCDTQSEGEV